MMKSGLADIEVRGVILCWCVYVSGGVIGQNCRSEGGSGLEWVREREN